MLLLRPSSHDVDGKNGAWQRSQKMDWSLVGRSTSSASGSASEVPHMEPGREVAYTYPHGLGRPPPHALPPHPPPHMFSSPHHPHPQSPTGPGGHHPMSDGLGGGGGGGGQGAGTAPPTPGPCGPSNGSTGGGSGGGGASSPLVVPQPVKAPRPIRTYHCRMCDQVFDSRSDLLVHSQHVHKQDPKPYKCPTCNKCFANSSYLSQHARIHSGVKPYKCQICERRFTQLCHLQQHIRTHTGEKPYKCQHPGCGKAFSQLSNLQSHSRSHMTDKPYRCNSCYKCFVDEQSLREHIPKHSETKHLKTHICKICGKSYTQETYLARHMTKHSDGGGGSPRGSVGSNNIGGIGMCGVPHMSQNTHIKPPPPLPVVSSSHMLGGRGSMESPIDPGMHLGSLHDGSDKSGSAFMPLPHQFGPGPNFINSTVPSNFPFPSPRLPSANASSLNSLSHVSCPGVPSPQRYFPFDPLPLPKRDAMMDTMMDRGLPRDMGAPPSGLLSRRQMKEFSTSHPVFPKSEPSSPMPHCPKDY